MKQMDRRLLILMRLREERPVRAADLAEVCECSVRTIYRDIDALCVAGVPVAAMPGEGYRLVEGYHLPPIAFTAEEAVQLLLGSDIALGLGTVSQREATLSAAAKVEAALRPETREEVDRLRGRIRVSRWAQHETTPWLPLLQQAVINDHVLELRYHSFGSDELTQRQVEIGPNAFNAGGTTFLIDGHSEVSGKNSDPPRVLINFFVDDLTAEQARLESASVEFIRKAGKEEWGGVISTFVDPDGNYGQLIEFKQG